VRKARRSPFRSKLLALGVVLCALVCLRAQAPQPVTGVFVAAPAATTTLTCNGTTVICVSQAGAGAQDGTSAANARPFSFVTNGANWGTGSTQIAPGDTVALNGTITTSLTLPGSGSSAGMVTIDGTNATMGSAVQFTCSGRNWVTIKNWTYPSGSTAGATITTCDHITIDGLVVPNGTGGVFWGVNTTNMVLRNSYLQQTTVDQGSQFDIIDSEGTNGLLIEGNYFALRSRGTCASCHDDAFQTFCHGNSCIAGQTPQNITIRYNRWEMDTTVANNKSLLQFEGIGGTNAIYGNIFYGIQGADAGNGMLTQTGQAGVGWTIINNTTYVANGLENTWRLCIGNCGTSGGSGSLAFRNNITSSPAGTVYCNSPTTGCGSGTWSPFSRTNNNWTGGNAPSCLATELCSSPLFTNQAAGVLTLTASSPGKGTGTVIANTGGQTFNVGLAPAATWPNPTLQTRNATTWDMGAYVMTP
jgi:hypothetical protein